MEKMSELIILKAPSRLVDALEAEARRRMTNKSALVREVLAASLGLLDPTDGS